MAVCSMALFSKHGLAAFCSDVKLCWQSRSLLLATLASVAIRSFAARVAPAADIQLVSESAESLPGPSAYLCWSAVVISRTRSLMIPTVVWQESASVAVTRKQTDRKAHMRLAITARPVTVILSCARTVARRLLRRWITCSRNIDVSVVRVIIAVSVHFSFEEDCIQSGESPLRNRMSPAAYRSSWTFSATTSIDLPAISKHTDASPAASTLSQGESGCANVLNCPGWHRHSHAFYFALLICQTPLLRI